MPFRNIGIDVLGVMLEDSVLGMLVDFMLGEDQDRTDLHHCAAGDISSRKDTSA